jgi:hypothetical protein
MSLELTMLAMLADRRVAKEKLKALILTNRHLEPHLPSAIYF